MPHAGRPPLGRSPSTPPSGRSLSYPLARQPSSASTGSLSARQLANANLNGHFPADSGALSSPGRPASGVSSSLSLDPEPSQQPDQALQHLHSSETLPGYMHRWPATLDGRHQWPASCALPAPLASHLPSEAQHPPGALPLQHPASTHLSMQGRAAPPTHSNYPQAAVRRTSSTIPAVLASGSLPVPAPVPRLGASMTGSPSCAVGGASLRGSRAGRGRGGGSEVQCASSSLPADFSAASWVQSQSAQQLTASVKQLAAQVASAPMHAVPAACLLVGSSYGPPRYVNVIYCHETALPWLPAAVCSLLCVQYLNPTCARMMLTVAPWTVSGIVLRLCT